MNQNAASTLLQDGHHIRLGLYLLRAKSWGQASFP
jgi:hypothetical protein